MTRQEAVKAYSRGMVEKLIGTFPVSDNSEATQILIKGMVILAEVSYETGWIISEYVQGKISFEESQKQIEGLKKRTE